MELTGLKLHLCKWCSSLIEVVVIEDFKLKDDVNHPQAKYEVRTHKKLALPTCKMRPIKAIIA
jgi:hypothetical protein